MASGKPFNPSINAMKISSTPRFLISVKTLNQKLAPSVSPTYQPSKSLCPSISTAKQMYAAIEFTFFDTSLTL